MNSTEAKSRIELNSRLSSSEIIWKKEIPYLALLGMIILLANLPLLFQKTYQNLSAFMIDYLVGVLYAFNGLGENLRNGYFFLWGPEMGCGVPVLAYYLSGLAYPPSLILSPARYPVNIILFCIAHFELIGIFSFLAFRRLALSRPASLLVSGWNALTGYTIWVSMVPSVISPLPWFYLIIFLLASPRETNRAGNFMLLILGFCLMLLSGDPEETLYAGYFGGAWLLLYWFFSRNGFPRKTIILAIFGLALALILSLAQIFPTLNFLTRGTRAIRPSYDVYLESFISLKLVAGGLAGLFSRSFLNLFFSFFALAFAVWAIFRKSKEPAVRASVIIIIIMTLLLIFPEIGLGQIPYHLPLFSHFVRHYKLGYLFQFLVLVLAGFGLEMFLEEIKRDERSLKKSILILLAFIIAGFTLAKFNLLMLLPMLLAFMLWRWNWLRQRPSLIMTLILMLDVFPYLWRPPYPFYKFDPPKYWSEYEKKARASRGKYRLQVFYPGIYFLSHQQEIPLPLQVSAPPGGETFDFYLTFPLKDYTDFLGIINPEINKPPADFAMIFNWPLLFKSQDYINPENRHLLNMLGLRWLFLNQFALKESDKRNFVYDPAYFLNPAIRTPYRRYKLKKFMQHAGEFPALISNSSADFYYQSEFSAGDEIDFRISSGNDPTWFLITAINQDEPRLVFARLEKSVDVSEIFSAKIPVPSQKLGFIMLKSGDDAGAWLDPVIRNERKPIKHRTGKEPALFENPEAMPRGWLVHQAQVFQDRKQLLNTLADPSEFHPDRTVLLLGDGKETYVENFSMAEPGQEKVELVEYSRERIRLSVKLSGQGFLVWMDQYYPGWRAFVNGEEKRILRANLCFRALRLNPGVQEIVFLFHPIDFRIGIYSAIISCLFLAGMALFSVFQRMRSSS